MFSHRTTTDGRTLVTEPHVWCTKDQIAQAVLDTELDTTPTNAVVIDAAARFATTDQGDHGEMHDVFIVISESSGGRHIVRTFTPPAKTTHAKDIRKITPTNPSSRFNNRTILARRIRRRATTYRDRNMVSPGRFPRSNRSK